MMKLGNAGLIVSRTAAILLLIIYLCLLVFVLRTHKDLINDDTTNKDKEHRSVGLFFLHEPHKSHEQKINGTASAEDNDTHPTRPKRMEKSKLKRKMQTQEMKEKEKEKKE
ncbi:hypothetical protein RFI_22325 [Reticulomyxa filosa]|uniref:Uncharacterized protein n=1 Tax=Reticulomyxa filosa TaxID=46433 RepID=X6MMG5_RETFI|nr:hypothetical protein RFI_22325 [Reticulomyxa filosa]|eukprot:ETO15039.1 hypothetical protein RFI_22325 [Reticulomyxa filosa]